MANRTRRIALLPWISLIVAFISPTRAGASGTQVRNGGELLLNFLSTTRNAVSEALTHLHADGEGRESLCGSLALLSAEERSECRDFILDHRLKLLELSSVVDRIGFKLAPPPLLWPGPDGQMVRVDAGTDSADFGDVQFDEERLQTRSPAQVFQLIVHELGHKLVHRGAYVKDDLPVGSFRTGRELLDSAAVGLAEYAERRAIIAARFKLEDYFACSFSYENPDPLVPAGSAEKTITIRLERLRIPRRYPDRSNQGLFESSLGHGHEDLGLSVDISELNARYRMNARMRESTSCSANPPPGTRATRVELIGEPLNGDPLVERVHVVDEGEGKNPICEGRGAVFHIGHQGFGFECSYLYAQGGFAPPWEENLK